MSELGLVRRTKKCFTTAKHGISKSHGKYYNARVKQRRLKVGDLVLKKVIKKTGALELNWDRPYKIKDVVRIGTYQLIDLNGRQHPHVWNAERLKLYYQ